MLCVLRGKTSGDYFVSTGQSNQEEIATDDSEENEPFNGAEVSESVLGRDWNSEDAAWSNL